MQKAVVNRQVSHYASPAYQREGLSWLINSHPPCPRVGFLNKIIALLWPNINVAGCDMVKQIVEPMFATMLPGPLKGLKFTKLDLGPVPLVLSKVEVMKTSEDQGIKVDMNVDWEGKCDVELGGHMIPKLVSDLLDLRRRLFLSDDRRLMCFLYYYTGRQNGSAAW
jgi:hypothetical protein